jgi:hypothetical protein
MSDPRREATWRVADALFLALRAGQSYGGNHPAFVASVDALRLRMIEASPAFTLQFMPYGVFRNGGVVPIDFDRYERACTLQEWLAAAKASEIAVRAEPSLDEVTELVLCLCAPKEGMVAQLALPTLAVKEIEELSFVLDGSLLDAESFAIAQMALALEAAEDLVGDGAWPSARALTTLRRIERAHATHAAAASRSVELAPVAWSPARRAVSASLLTLTTLGDLDTSAGSRRAAAHAALLLGCSGLWPRSGDSVERAATLAHTRLLASCEVARTISPHEILVASLLAEIARGGRPDRLGALVRLLYELERRRSPPGIDFDLTRLDVIADLLHQGAPDVAASWIKILVSSNRALPPGVRVQLADGTLAVVMGPGADLDPFRPEVKVGGTRFVPDAPVTVVVNPKRRSPSMP